MPGRNLTRQELDNAYYHVYNRGVNKQSVFLDEQDFSVFLNLLKRYLGSTPQKDRSGRLYPWFPEEVELLTFCLMPNHFHLLLYQKHSGGVMKLLKGVCTSYTMYFNRKYKRVGPLFQNHYRSSLINSESYLLHISRYIHLNPRDYKKWEWSSLPYYLKSKQSDWLHPQRVLDLFEGDSYERFVGDYEEHRSVLEEIKSELANT